MSIPIPSMNIHFGTIYVLVLKQRFATTVRFTDSQLYWVLCHFAVDSGQPKRKHSHISFSHVGKSMSSCSSHDLYHWGMQTYVHSIRRYAALCVAPMDTVSCPGADPANAGSISWDTVSCFGADPRPSAVNLCDKVPEHVLLPAPGIVIGTSSPIVNEPASSNI
jgi:hypothetical protein